MKKVWLVLSLDPQTGEPIVIKGGGPFDCPDDAYTHAVNLARKELDLHIREWRFADDDDDEEEKEKKKVIDRKTRLINQRQFLRDANERFAASGFKSSYAWSVASVSFPTTASASASILTPPSLNGSSLSKKKKEQKKKPQKTKKNVRKRKVPESMESGE